MSNDVGVKWKTFLSFSNEPRRVIVFRRISLIFFCTNWYPVTCRQARPKTMVIFGPAESLAFSKEKKNDEYKSNGRPERTLLKIVTKLN
jgi:hypothetical protein